MIEVTHLSRTFFTHQKEPGVLGSIKSLFSRQFVEKKAVCDASLTVGPGEIVGLIGANGAGKTTLVKMLSGIIHPTSGTARVLGFTPWERPRQFREQISLVMGQKAQLWWDIPALDSFLLLKEIYRIGDPEYTDRLHHLLEVLGVGEIVKTPVRKLSLGERMKMELIASLLHQPKVVFLDEPTIGLDVTAQQAIRNFIREYQKKYRPAVILTSHYMEDIEKLCERIIILREGSVVYDGSLSQVLEKFATHKMFKVGWNPNLSYVESQFNVFGTVTRCIPGSVEMKVSRKDSAQVASQLLTKFQVNDLSIEEEEISSIVSNILRN